MSTGRRLLGTGVVVSLLALPVLVSGAGDKARYIVKPGDTLSKVAAKEMGDARKWREILKENPQIKSANRIYPGDVLTLPIPTVAAAPEPAPTPALEAAPAPAEAPPAEAPPPEVTEVVQPPLPREVVRDVPVVKPHVYHGAGYVAQQLPGASILSAVGDHLSLVTGDEVVLSVPAAKGTRFVMVRPTRKLIHPVSGEHLGWVMWVVGEATVVRPGERTAIAVIGEVRDAAQVGDLLIAYNPEDVLEENLLRPPSKVTDVAPGPPDAMVVAFEDERIEAGDNDVAFIDRGSDAGVVPGKRYLIYREVKPEGRVVVGELQVLRVGPRASTGFVTASAQEIKVADLLRAQ